LKTKIKRKKGQKMKKKKRIEEVGENPNLSG